MTAQGMVRLEDYRPFPYRIHSIGLDIDLAPEETRVRSRLQVERAPDTGEAAPLVLDGKDLELVSARLDGRLLGADDYAATPDRFELAAPPSHFVLEIEVLIRPARNKTKKGLFWHANALATQCEAEGFRRITYFPDRPDVLATYEVRLEADRARFPVLLSNGDLFDSGGQGDRHWTVWRDPYPKPSYIFAIMAGVFRPLSDRFVTASGRPVDISIFAEPGEQARCRFAMAALKSAMVWDERVFGLEYDLTTYNVVALPDYAGAQENKGLNLFGAEGVIADPAITTDEEFSLIQRIIGHEYFHNWTGNRVTCRDWFQLSLKEGLTRLRDQLFMEDVLEPGTFRIDQVKALRRNQFPEDDGPAAHPVRPEAFTQIENFYTTTIYDKGAEVLRMLRALVGPAAFAATIKAYLDRFDGRAVTMEDLFEVFESQNPVGLTQFRHWLIQAGRPTLAVTSHYDAEAKRFTLRMTQALPPKPGPGEPLHIPVGVALFDSDGHRLAEPVLLELREAEQSFAFEGLEARPIPSILRQFSAPVSLDLDLSDEDLALLAVCDDDAFVAWNSAQQLFIGAIRRLSRDLAERRPLVAPEGLIALVERLVRDGAARPGLAALKLALPDEPVLSEGLSRIDLDGHMAARQFIRAQIATRLEPLLLATYEGLAGIDPDDRSANAIGRRSLRSALLDLLLARGGDAAVALCLDQLEHGPSITESYEALCLLAHLDTPERRPAFERFHDRYRDQPLILDKWFKAYALSRAPGVIDEIIGLEGHPAYDIGNTARVIAYYGSLFRQNRVTFHDPSGKGYRFLADRLILMDQMGGGRPTYFMSQIDQWRRFDDHRAGLMRAELERVAKTPGISANLIEVVTRALG